MNKKNNMGWFEFCSFSFSEGKAFLSLDAQVLRRTVWRLVDKKSKISKKKFKKEMQKREARS